MEISKPTKYTLAIKRAALLGLLFSLVTDLAEHLRESGDIPVLLDEIESVMSTENCLGWVNQNCNTLAEILEEAEEQFKIRNARPDWLSNLNLFRKACRQCVEDAEKIADADKTA